MAPQLRAGCSRARATWVSISANRSSKYADVWLPSWRRASTRSTKAWETPSKMAVARLSSAVSGSRLSRLSNTPERPSTPSIEGGESPRSFRLWIAVSTVCSACWLITRSPPPLSRSIATVQLTEPRDNILPISWRMSVSSASMPGDRRSRMSRFRPLTDLISHEKLAPGTEPVARAYPVMLASELLKAGPEHHRLRRLPLFQVLDERLRLRLRWRSGDSARRFAGVRHRFRQTHALPWAKRP